jgi:hypothetical protein
LKKQLEIQIFRKPIAYASYQQTTNYQLPPRGSNAEPATNKHREMEHNPRIIKQLTLARYWSTKDHEFCKLISTNLEAIRDSKSLANQPHNTKMQLETAIIYRYDESRQKNTLDQNYRLNKHRASHHHHDKAPPIKQNQRSGHTHQNRTEQEPQDTTNRTKKHNRKIRQTSRKNRETT